MKDISELIEKIVADSEFRTLFFQDPQVILKKYDLTMTDEELDKCNRHQSPGNVP